MTAHGLAPGAVVGDYRLERELGRGAMGVVYLATHLRQSRQVAIKFLAESWANHPEVRERFAREARAAMAVRHPSVVEVVDYGTSAEGLPFLVMEHLDGISLAELQDRVGALEPRVASAVLVPVLEALAQVHGAGIVHRDLKPANVMLTRGTRRAVKLVDFGLAQIVGSQRITRAGAVLGTPDHMAPEQVRDALQTTAASDLYAVGVMAFELLAGRLPLAAADSTEMMRKVVLEQPPTLRSVCPQTDDRLGALVDALLAKDPASRPGSAEARATLLAAAPPDARALWALVDGPEEFVVAPTRVRQSHGPRAVPAQSGPVPVIVEPRAEAHAPTRVEATPVRSRGAGPIVMAAAVGGAAVAVLAMRLWGAPVSPPAPAAEPARAGVEVARPVEPTEPAPALTPEPDPARKPSAPQRATQLAARPRPQPKDAKASASYLAEANAAVKAGDFQGAKASLFKCTQSEPGNPTCPMQLIDLCKRLSDGPCLQRVVGELEKQKAKLKP